MQHGAFAPSVDALRVLTHFIVAWRCRISDKHGGSQTAAVRQPARPGAAPRAYEGRVVEQQPEVVWNPLLAASQKRKGEEQERLTRSSNK